MRTLFAIVSLLTVSGCALVDPHNLIGRSTPPILSSSPIPNVDPKAWRQPALDMVWNTINEKYYDATLNGVDWRAVRARYEPLLQATDGDDDYWELLDKMTGELRDSHTRVHSAKQAEQQRNNEAHGLGINFRELTTAKGNLLVLTSVHPESDAYWAGVRAGMVITRIEGQAALPYFRALIPAVRDSSSVRARERGAVRKISAGIPGSAVSMVFETADNFEIAVTMKRRVFKVPPRMSERVLPSGFGYISFSGFTGSLAGGIQRAITNMKDTPGMIIDLRNNGGGAADMANAILSRFLTENTKGPKIITRTGKPPSLFFYAPTKLETELKADRKNAYTKPLVVLMNEGSASASEGFAVLLQELGRATIVGERSCGCLLGYLGYAELPGGGRMAYSEIGVVTPKGRRVEGDGVIPDRGINLSQDDYLFNRDPGLEVAQQILREQSATGKAN